MFNSTTNDQSRVIVGSQQACNSTSSEPAEGATSSRNELPLLSSSQYRVHSIKADGDCFFRSLGLGLQNAIGEVSDATVLNLRENLATFIRDYSSVLSNHPSFQQAGLQDLYSLTLTQGQWNSDAGDLVPILAAQVTGREIHILEPCDENHYRELQVMPAYNHELPGVDQRPTQGQELPGIYLLKHNWSHYELLEEMENSVPVVSDEALPSPKRMKFLESSMVSGHELENKTADSDKYFSAQSDSKMIETKEDVSYSKSTFSVSDDEKESYAIQRSEQPFVLKPNPGLPRLNLALSLSPLQAINTSDSVESGLLEAIGEYEKKTGEKGAKFSEIALDSGLKVKLVNYHLSDSGALRAKVGEGQFGKVRQGLMEIDGVEKAVAVKKIHVTRNSMAADELHNIDHIRGLFKEATGSNNVLRCYGSATQQLGGEVIKAYSVFEACDGTILDLFLDNESGGKVPMPLEQVANIGTQIYSGLDFLHNHKVVHGDGKPTNYGFISNSDGSTTVKIMDFGTSGIGGKDAISTTQAYKPFGMNLDRNLDVFQAATTLAMLILGLEKPPVIGNDIECSCDNDELLRQLENKLGTDNEWLSFFRDNLGSDFNRITQWSAQECMTFLSKRQVDQFATQASGFTQPTDLQSVINYKS